MARFPRIDTFLATLRPGVQRAERVAGEWRVETVLSDREVRCLAAAGDGVWAGTNGDGVWWSADGGRSWRPAGLDGRVVTALAPSPHDPAVVYAGLKPAHVAVTTDGGARWAELESFRKIPGRWFWFSPAERPFSAYVQGLAVSPTDPDVVAAGIEFGAVVRSDDGGRTWSRHRRGAIRDCHSLTFHATSGDHLYEAGAGFPRRPFAGSVDAGVTWWSPKRADLGYGWACAADPGDPGTVYCSAASGPGAAHGPGPAQARIYRSRGGGEWVPLSGGLPEPLDGMPYALITDPEKPGHLYAGLSSGHIWFSDDAGDEWSRLDVELDRIERMLVALP